MFFQEKPLLEPMMHDSREKYRNFHLLIKVKLSVDLDYAIV